VSHGWPFQELGRILLLVGILLAVAGAVLLLAGKVTGIGRLPGDLVLQRGRWTVFLPVGTMVVLSILLTILLNLLFRR
jgi:hypothetical protein